MGACIAIKGMPRPLIGNITGRMYLVLMYICKVDKN